MKKYIEKLYNIEKEVYQEEHKLEYDKRITKHRDGTISITLRKFKKSKIESEGDDTNDNGLDIIQ